MPFSMYYVSMFSDKTVHVVTLMLNHKVQIKLSTNDRSSVYFKTELVTILDVRNNHPLLTAMAATLEIISGRLECLFDPKNIDSQQVGNSNEKPLLVVYCDCF